ncbi:MAG: DUF1289 domain-containing protein [Halomonadaceae bacterium]|nr:MAG: DUF1289 domain-containing protein [Halomonadaceae bacterium]
MEGPRDRTIESPCISVCALDENDLCIGCQRTVSEITRWAAMTAAEKQEVLEMIAEREKKMLIGGRS